MSSTVSKGVRAIQVLRTVFPSQLPHLHITLFGINARKLNIISGRAICQMRTIRYEILTSGRASLLVEILTRKLTGFKVKHGFWPAGNQMNGGLTISIRSRTGRWQLDIAR